MSYLINFKFSQQERYEHNMKRTKSSIYEVYRILQPRSDRRQTGSLFDDNLTDSERRMKMIREAISIGMSQHNVSSWVAGSVREIPDGVMFKVGEKSTGVNYAWEDGVFLPTTQRGMNVTDILIDFPTGLMLVYKSKSTPSAFIAAQKLGGWLTTANEQNDTGFKVMVRSVPLEEDFLQELNRANLVTAMTFVVHPPNPADESEIMERLVKFTDENGLSSTTVTVNAPDIDRNLATNISRAMISLGQSVSATIHEAGGLIRTIKTKKKPRSLMGEPDPSVESATGLLLSVKGQLSLQEDNKEP